MTSYDDFIARHADDLRIEDAAALDAFAACHRARIVIGPTIAGHAQRESATVTPSYRARDDHRDRLLGWTILAVVNALAWAAIVWVIATVIDVVWG